MSQFPNIKKSKSVYSSQYTFMFKSYLLTALRSAIRNRATSLINVLGLSLGVGFAITVFLFMDFMFHIDGFHVNRERIYQITSHVQHDKETDLWGDSPYLLGPALKADHLSPISWSRLATDALDWFGYWKTFDALMDTAFSGKPFAVDASMGAWSDGTPVAPLKVER